MVAALPSPADGRFQPLHYEHEDVSAVPTHGAVPDEHHGDAARPLQRRDQGGHSLRSKHQLGHPSSHQLGNARGVSIIHGQEISTSKRLRYLPVIVADKNFLL